MAFPTGPSNSRKTPVLCRVPRGVGGDVSRRSDGGDAGFLRRGPGCHANRKRSGFFRCLYRQDALARKFGTLLPPPRPPDSLVEPAVISGLVISTITLLVMRML